MIRVRWQEKKSIPIDANQGMSKYQELEHIEQHSGKIVGSAMHSYMGWYLLVLCDDNELREVQAAEVEILAEKDKAQKP